MRLPFLLLALLAGLAGCDSGETVSASITEPWIRLSAIPGRPASGYAAIAATPDHGALTGVTSPRAGRIEMHETMMSGSMASMRPVARISLADNPEIVFAPGGRHLMLFDIDPKLKPGGRTELVFHFEHGPPVTASARVAGAGDEAPY